MPSDRTGEPWTGATYNGFSGPTVTEAPSAWPEGSTARVSTTRSVISKRNVIIGCVATAVAAGLLFGLWARTPARDVEKAGPKAEASTPAAVPIEVAQPAPLGAPKSAGPLEVLPPDQAAAARAAAPTMVTTRPTSSAISAPVVPVTAPRTVPQPRVIQGRDVAAIAPAVEDPPMPPPRLRRGAINCGAPTSAYDAQICEDAGLLPADPPRMSRAERRARREAALGEPFLRAPPREAPDEEPVDAPDADPGY